MAELKLVSFKVAKTLKEAGYPQLKADWSYCSKSGELVHFVDDADYVIPAPTYLAVWLWLWREKGVKYEIVKSGTHVLCKEEPYKFHYENDPEGAIIGAINYLIDNDLIK